MPFPHRSNEISVMLEALEMSMKMIRIVEMLRIEESFTGSLQLSSLLL